MPWNEPRPRRAFDLVRERANANTLCAVPIDWGGQKLGCLPRLSNAFASQLLDRGERRSACIAALAEGSDPWRRVAVEVYPGPTP